MSSTYHSLASSNFVQDWSDSSLLTLNDDWSGVPSIIGYRGDDLTAATGVDPQTVLGDGTNPGVVDVNVNQISPGSFNTGGVAEFDGIPDRTVALNGSGTADAPFLVVHLDSTGRENVTVQFNARDIDDSIDNAIQQVAVQYRLGASGDWTNVPGSFVSDATTGPNLATAVTQVNVTLPSDANNQAQLQVRIITTNAVGSDEWVGIDDIIVSSAPLSAAVVLQNVTVSPLSALEDTGSFTVTATLSAAAVSDTVVSLSYSQPAELASPPATVTILAGQTSGSVTVSPSADTVFEANEAVTVTATLGATQKQAAFTILNDDAAPSTINGIEILPVADSTLTGSTTTPTASNALNVKKLASFATTNDSGIAVGAGGAESIAFDASTKKAFVTNAALDRIDIIDLSNPAAPAKLSPIDLKVLTGYGEVNSVAISKGIVAVAVQNTDGTQPGVVALFDTDGVLQKTLTVGVLPDQLTFTSTGLLVVANEAEALSAASNPSGSITIIDVSGGAAAATVRNTIDFTALNGNEAALSANGIKIFNGQSASADIEPEYVAVSADGKKAYVTLQEVNTVAVIDLTDAAATKPVSLLPLGFVNHTLAGNEGDFSDRDGAGNTTSISINTSPLKGLLQPDALATFAVGGLTYFITANEGDARVGTSLVDEVRASASPFSVTDTDYARVNVNTTFSTPGDLYSFGGRGFSIFRDNGDGTFTKVEESGGEFEKIIAAQTPASFNGDAGAPNTFDTRSDNKGPEPEGVDIAVIDGRTYAFIGLERGNGLMVYDVTDPTNASFVRYVPFSTGDNSPEVLKVISSADSPTGRPLILSANEVSGTVAIYEIVAPQIASGAPDQDSIILWGKATATGTATFEVATDAAFSNILTGLTQNVVVTDVDIPAKVEVAGLTSNTQYYYRFSDGVATSEVGTFSTAGSLSDGKLGLHFGVSGDWRGELAPYPSISNADTAGLKFFVALGDTIYSDYPSPRVPANQATTLDEFRAKHDEVYSDRYGVNTFGDLRAKTPILATIDDHEVTNDFQGGALASSDPRFAGAPAGTLINQTDLYKNGLQAFTEYNPIAAATYTGTGDPTVDGRPKLYSTENFGKDAATFVLDLRTFRDQGLVDADISSQADVGRFLTQSFDPSRTMLGSAQLSDLKADLLAADNSGVTWKFVFVPEPIQNLGPLAASDRFEGYAAERTEILKFIEDNAISNVVFVTADLHGTIVNNLTYQTGVGQAQIATGAFEVITGSVAFDAPFGQTVGGLAAQLGLLSPQQSAFYNSLPVAADTDAIPNDKDDFIESLINSQISAFGYDPIGLDQNLAQASGRINAKLLSGDYLAAHTFGWTDFQIDQATQKLTVTTYGIPPYSEAELLANPAAITSRTPTIVSQFTVDAQQAVTRIFDIQGSGAVSPLVGQTVTTRGIVTAVDTNGSRGFWIQDASGDSNPDTSDGIFVFLGSGPALPTVGDLVSVTGRVSEFTPSGAASGSLSVTQLSAVTNVSTLLAASLADDIAPVVIGGPGGLLPPTQSLAQGVSFWEKFEGMQVTIKQAIAVGPTNNFGEIYTVVDNDADPTNGTSATGQTERGNLLLTPGAESFGNTDTVGGDFNPERIQIDDDNGVVAGFTSPLVDVGARLSDVTGVVGYNFGNYEVVATNAFTVSQPSTLVKETSTLTGDSDHILIASYNAENLSPNDLASGKFETIAAEIFNTLNRPDIVALQEIQDNDGATNSTVTSASLTLQTLVDKINALATSAGSTAHYSFIDNPFIVDDANGGQPGGNIRNAYLYRDDRVSFVPTSLKTIDANGTAITGNGDQATNPDNPFFSSRLPLVATFEFAGEEVSVINNHFTSKGGSGALLGSVEPPLNGGEVQRAAQAQAVNNFVDGLLAVDATARVVVAGDLNEFPFEQPISVLKGTASISGYDVPGTNTVGATATYTPGGNAVLQDLQELLPANERYDYVFEGNSQTLDHILVTSGAATGAQFDVLRINSEFASQTSDHDPLLARLNMTTNATAFSLQILHMYGESGTLAVDTAPNLAALVDKFNDNPNTIVVAEGDNWIPGPFLVAGADPSLNALSTIKSTALARPDVAILNSIGTTVSALGNHEFDLGSPVVSGAIAASGAWVGAQFPIITANVDVSADSSLRGLSDASLGGTATNAFAGQETTAIKGKLAPYAVKTIGTEKIGFVGATTFELLSKTSPNGTKPKDDNPNAVDANDLQEVVTAVQGAVDALKAMGVNKIVMVDQLDTLARNKAIAPLLSGVDVMVAGGGHERMGDANDVPAAFNGHDPDFIADAYPIVINDKDGNPTVIVTTDTEFTYLGRLNVDFDANGNVIVGNLDINENGAYAATAATVEAVYGNGKTAAEIIAGSTMASEVKSIVDAIDNVLTSKGSNIYGYTDVYLEGDRVFGRAQEVNLGNLTADANSWKAKEALGLGATDALVSLKNGGGIRASIGSIDEDGKKIGPAAVPGISGPGAISQLDVENALRFDNKMMVFDTTPQGLLNILNFAAGLAPGNGGYNQLGGIAYSYDPTKPAGSKVSDVALLDSDGNVIQQIVDNGLLLPGAPATITMVALNFNANGGDGYPIKANGENFRYILNDGTLSGPIDESLDFTATVNVPANALGEQKALEDYLETFHGTPQTAYDQEDTPSSVDARIQNLSVRPDGFTAINKNGTSGNDLIAGSLFADIVNGQSGNDTIYGFAGNDTLRGSNGNDTINGGAGNDLLSGDGGNDIVKGGAGDDVFTVSYDQRNDTIDGGTGFDTIRGINGSAVLLWANIDGIEAVDGSAAPIAILGSSGNDQLDLSNISLAGTVSIEAGLGNDTVFGGNGAQKINGGQGDDTLHGNSMNDVLLGGDGNDTIFGLDGADTIDGQGGMDTIQAGNGNDDIIVSWSSLNDSFDGGQDFDTLVSNTANARVTWANVHNIEAITATGSARIDILGSVSDDVIDLSGIAVSGNVVLNGSGGHDRIIGSTAADIIVGGVGGDELTGGGGADRFDYNSTFESRAAGGIDVITDFVQALDKIDLSTIDANGSLAGDAFNFIGSLDFSNIAGQLRFDTATLPGYTRVQGDINGNGVADFEVRLAGNYTLTAGDFIL